MKNVYHRAMSYAEAVLSLTPAGYWRMGELSAPIVDTANANNSNVTGGSPTFGALGAIQDDANNAVTYDGSTEYFDVPDHATLDLGDTFTIMVWLKRAANGAFHNVVDKDTNGYQLRLADNNTVQLCKSATSILVDSTTTITDTTYHHVVATKDAATVKLYIDGVDVTGTVTNATMGDTTSALEIGRSYFLGGSQHFNGTLDELALFDYALTADQVRWLYSIGKTGDLKRRAA